MEKLLAQEDFLKQFNIKDSAVVQSVCERQQKNLSSF